MAMGKCLKEFIEAYPDDRDAEFLKGVEQILTECEITRIHHLVCKY